MLRKTGKSPLLLAGLAAAGYYAYNKMSPVQKQQLIEKGKKLISGLPLGNLRNMLGKAGI